ncbi:MAG: hypothetical protein C0618_09235 [Desulfuromonas sp.]|nr:MAG: hypothetical protein C0618_09235 [Desulfuromonas sp.]
MMAEEQPFRTVTLHNGLVLTFTDKSNRYFGDYHRVSICVEGTVPCALFSSLADQTAQKGEVVLYRRTLERMGVSTQHIATVVDELVDAFLRVTRSYLENPDTPQRLFKKKQADEHSRLGRRLY